MANYSKETKQENGKEVVRYKDGKKYVDGKDVPENVRSALNEVREGTVVDELGDEVEMYNGKPLATGSITDEKAPTKDDLDADDDDDDDSDDDTPQKGNKTPDDTDVIDDDPNQKKQEKAAQKSKPAAKPRSRKQASDDSDDDDVDGMGFPRKNGKTVDIFDSKTPHTHVKPVAGLMVPLSEENFNTKSDTQIMERLREMGKIS